MKKAVLLIALGLFTVVLASCEAKPTLKVFMPNEYIDTTLIEAFEDEFNVRVELITFDSNESALPQIKVNSYDVVIPSDYAIEELAEGGFLETIDWSLLTDVAKDDLDPALISLIEHVSEGNNGFDLLTYSVPYFWGNVGLLYDTTKVTNEFLTEHGWESLNLINDSVMFYDSSRDMAMVALKALFGGEVDINNPSNEELTSAENWLKGSNRTSSVVYASDEIFDDMLSPTKYAIAVSYSGDAVYLMSENEDLDYYVPTEGSNVWIDGMVIPKNATNKDLAYTFINYFSSYDVMYLNSEYIGYTAPRLDVVDALLEEDVYLESSYKMVVRLTDSVFRFNEANKTTLAEFWAKVRASNN